MTVLRQSLGTRPRLAVLLVLVFLANYLETQWENVAKSPATYALGYRINQAFYEIEGRLQFGPAERVGHWALGGYTVAYFVLLPLLLLGCAAMLWRRENVRALRVFVVSVALSYLLALPFYLFLPVPERWAFPGANATLLSDLLSTRLIEAVRPISGLDNCFPSMHVGLTVLVVLPAYWHRSPWRHCLACLGGMVVLSTFFLGIHWLPDIAMGVAVAALAFALALLADQRLFPETGVPAPARPATASRTRKRSRTPLLFPRKTEKLVFISYRREGGSRLARVVQIELERRGFPCFLDVDDLGSELFDGRLLAEIEKAPNTVVVLAPGSMDRCRREDDWLRREIAHALKHRRNVVPLLADGFEFPDLTDWPGGLEDLPRLNGVTYSHEYFGAAFDKLEGFLKRE